MTPAQIQSAADMGEPVALDPSLSAAIATNFAAMARDSSHADMARLQAVRDTHLRELAHQDEVARLRREREQALTDLENAVDVVRGLLEFQAGAVDRAMAFLRGR